MTIYLEDFREIVERLQLDDNESTIYRNNLAQVDSMMEEFVMENKYTNILYFQTQFLLDKLLGRELRETIEWYLYELPLVSEHTDWNSEIDGVKYNVIDLESFMDYAERGLKLPRKPV